MEFSAEDVKAPVRNYLHSDAAVPTSWDAQQLSGGYGNPITTGIYRVTGSATDRGVSTGWGMVVKMCQDPAKAGLAFLGSDEYHWNYWRREPYVYASGFFDDLPDAFSCPECYGIDERANGDIWLWLEDVGEAAHQWTEQRFAEAAYRAGRFNGAYMTERPLPTGRMLNSDFLRSWVGTMMSTFSYVTDPVDGRLFWEHPGVVELLGPPSDCPLLRFIEDLDRHYAALNRLPRTLCHRDVWRTNLLWPQPDRCVLIDWGLVGVGPVGEELVQLTWSAADSRTAMDPTGPYLAGLRESGWSGDDALVRYGHAAAFAARVGSLMIAELHGVPERIEPARSASEAVHTITADTLSKAEPKAREVRRATAIATELLG